MRRVALLVALLLMLALGASGCGTPGTRPAAVLPDRLAPVWSADTAPDTSTFGASQSLIGIADSAVVLPVPGGDLTVRDPRTGRIESRIAPDRGWQFSGDAVIGDRLYTSMTPPTGNLARFAAYDLGTGLAVWRTDVSAQLFSATEPQNSVITPHGIVLLLAAAGELGGLRLSDGKDAWLTRLPAGCPLAGVAGSPPTAAVTGSPTAAVFVLECTGKGARLISVDPASGRISWQRVLAVSRTDVYPITLDTTNAGDILAGVGNTVHVFTPGGRMIATPPTCPGGGCTIGSNGSDGVLVELGTNTSAIQGIDLGTGQVRWQRTSEPIGAAGPVDSSGTMYADSAPFLGGQNELLPQFVLAMQTTTGLSTVIPLPVASSFPIGTADGLLFVESVWVPSITAFRPEHVAMAGPTALGGVAAADWPDACVLLTPGDLRFIAAGYVFSPRPVSLPGVTWPKPVTCAYVGPGAGDPAVTLTVGWIAASTQQANELLASELAAVFTNDIKPSPIPGGYLVYDGAMNGGADRALIVAGRAIVELTVPGHPADARKLASIVAARLNATYG